MSVQDDKSTEQDTDQESADQDTDQKLTEKPEPDEDDKKKAAEMMEAYKEKPTIVLPGTGGSVSGTAVNDWLDEDGNPKHEVPEGADDSKDEAKSDDQRDEQALKEQIEKDKALNEKLKEAAEAENKGEKR
ncbi:hypothetical protein [Mycobacterium scrofulaceum]|uniref:Uncharacterized protein n=1 Tax=Mycobacterium scrofulaceum TaxID=1783 RepID=A0A1A2WCW4_MYCSC|nr:hypothetical protein [Mycobacterium scrofulaceum]OBH84046.1 hypothetical protein A5681_20370 [Mycobacterium scrofulaceum]OBI10731.1 hypothetical protein A5679_06290 [Mycobacterium scrofulaceum]